MEQTTDGFEIAEKDLALRGPGEFLGTRQSGVPGLTVADLARDQDLLRLAKEESGLLAEADPGLSRPEHAPLRRALDERWEGKLGLGRVG
jgi:ATP-dependent DNA helicase RecG